MNNRIERRNFIKTAAAGSIGLGLLNRTFGNSFTSPADSKRVGIIGLTPHTVLLLPKH